MLFLHLCSKNLQGIGLQFHMKLLKGDKHLIDEDGVCSIHSFIHSYLGIDYA